MCFGSLLDSKVFLVGNTYCNVRANGDNEVTLPVRPGAYVWWLKKGGHLITPPVGLRRPDCGTHLVSLFVSAGVAAKLPRPCRCADSLAPTIHRGLRQSGGSTADQSQSPRALS